MAVTVALDKGEYRAIPALVALNGELDRYHALAARMGASAADSEKPEMLQNLAPRALKSPDGESILQGVVASPEPVMVAEISAPLASKAPSPLAGEGGRRPDEGSAPRFLG